MQQYATGLIAAEDQAMTVGASVVSVYKQRVEALCDAGAIAMSKDTGPIAGFGPVASPARLKGWSLGRISQEHGILVNSSGGEEDMPEVGEFVRIVPQHAWHLVVDGEDEIVDVWVPCKGW